MQRAMVEIIGYDFRATRVMSFVRMPQLDEKIDIIPSDKYGGQLYGLKVCEVAHCWKRSLSSLFLKRPLGWLSVKTDASINWRDGYPYISEWKHGGLGKTLISQGWKIKTIHPERASKETEAVA